MIISTTITNNNQDIIGDALYSVVDWVDKILIIDTGITDKTLDIAKQIAGEKLLISKFTWCDSYGEARNFALQEAARFGGTWAVTLDTDERLIIKKFNIRNALKRALSDYEYAMVPFINNSYSKERFFRLPSKGKWEGPSHERFVVENGKALLLNQIKFDELPKTPETLKNKRLFSKKVIPKYMENDDSPRWNYYLGAVLHGLKEYDDALTQFKLCFEKTKWDEEAGYCAYRMGIIYNLKKDYKAAISICLDGMERHPGMAELPTMISKTYLCMKNYRFAMIWAYIAIKLGYVEGCADVLTFVGFRDIQSYWETPYQILYLICKATNNVEKADEYYKKYTNAMNERLATI